MKKSKGLAEKAAWDFIRQEGENLELATIKLVFQNPLLFLYQTISCYLKQTLSKQWTNY